MFRLAASNKRLRRQDDLTVLAHDIHTSVDQFELPNHMEYGELDECRLTQLPVISPRHMHTP